MTDTSVLNHVCKNFEEDLVLFYYGENGAAERSAIERHLEKCSGCRGFLDDLRRLLPQVGQEAERPQAFWDDYYRETIAKLAEQRESKHWWRDLVAPMKFWALPAFGTVAVTVLAIGLIFGKVNLGSVSNDTPPGIPQEILVDAEQLEFFQSLDMLESLSLLEDQERKTSEGKLNQSSLRRTDHEVA